MTTHVEGNILTAVSTALRRGRRFRAVDIILDYAKGAVYEERAFPLGETESHSGGIIITDGPLAAAYEADGTVNVCIDGTQVSIIGSLFEGHILEAKGPEGSGNITASYERPRLPERY